MVKTKNSPKWNLKYHKLIWLLLVLVLAVIGYFVYEKVALEMNKRDFQQARTAIDTVYADILIKIGKPDSTERNNSCYKTYNEFEGYRLSSCSVDTSFIYGVSGEQEANQKFKDIQATISSHGQLFKNVDSQDQIINTVLIVNNKYHEAQDKYSVYGLGCTAKYVYDTPQDTYLKLIKSSASHTLFVVIGCGGPAKHQYYPIET